MTLSQVTRLDAGKYAKEREELQSRITELEQLLSDRKALIALLKKEMQQLIKQFGDERRTVIDAQGQVLAPIERVASLHEREPLLIAFTRNGSLKALAAETFKARGKDAASLYAPVRGDEQLREVIATTSQDYLLCVCSTGRVHQIATHRVPVANRSAKGEPIRNLLELAPSEDVVAVVPVDAYDEDRYLVTFSKLGKVKKSPLSEYRTADVDGVQDMKLTDGDSVAVALVSNGIGEYFVTTSTAQTLRFSDENLRTQGRLGQGVAAMALSKDAVVVSASYLDSEQKDKNLGGANLLVVTVGGMAKKVPLSQYPQKGRATGGVTTIELRPNDLVLLTMLIRDTDTLLFTWSGEKGDQVTVLKGAAIKAFPRANKGEPIINGHVTGVTQL